MPQETAKTNISSLKYLIEGFNSQNKRHADLYERLSNAGHSLKNTRKEEASAKTVEEGSEGIVNELSKALATYEQINNMQEAELEKLSGII